MNAKRSFPVCLPLLAVLLFFACSADKSTTSGLSAESALTSLAKQGTAITSASADWGYTEEDGPKQWCFLDASFELCCEGRTGATQSPVNVTSRALEFADLPELEFDYERHTDLEVEHNGHTIEAEVPEGDGTLTIAGKSYTLVQFHWHTQSEHAVDGRLLPMEMHLVHKASDGALAVVGVFIIRGREHQELDKIWQDLPQHEGNHIEVDGFDLNTLLPRTRKTFRYGGSLTTPPCSEGVSWNMFVQPIRMSGDQIQAFVDVFSGEEFPHGNRRPTQPLNGRKLLTDLRHRGLTRVPSE